MKLESINNYEDFKAVVKGEDEIVLACFTAEWCSPCQSMKEELDVLHDELQGVPTIICYKKGKEKDRVGGYKKAASVRKLLKL